MQRRFILLCSMLLLFASACSATAPVDIGQANGPASVNGSTSVDIGTDSASAQAVFDEVKSSIVYVEAPDKLSSGSGVVIDGNWIVTNAHVVERHQQIRIGSGDGVDLGLHDVVAVDWVLDLALIGPVNDASLEPIEQRSSSEMGLGDRVLLIGFPFEGSIDPTPTLTEGILSRRRSIAVADVPFLQVDAAIAPGQSGGALLDGSGQLIGISGLQFGERSFALALASDALGPRLDQLLEKDDTVALPGGEGVRKLNYEIGPLRSLGFTIDVGESGSLDLSVSSSADVFVDVQTLGGVSVTSEIGTADIFRSDEGLSVLYVDELLQGGEDVVANLDPGTYQVVVGSFNDVPHSIEVTAANAMHTFSDLEEQAPLPVGTVIEGSFDWQQDSDRWMLTLEAGQEVVITTDAIADMLVSVRLNGEIVASSDDEGLGIFGTGSRVEFTAAEAGDYVVEVGSFDETRWGYFLKADVTG